MEEKKSTFNKGGFGKTAGCIEAAKKARLDKLGRPPRTPKEHNKWRQKQKRTFKLWRSFLDEE